MKHKHQIFDYNNQRYQLTWPSSATPPSSVTLRFPPSATRAFNYTVQWPPTAISSASKLSTEYEHTPETMPSGPSPFGTFGNVPLELRHMIYEPLFAAGSVDLTRASKALYEDTKESLGSHGVCRVTVVQDSEPGHRVFAQLSTIPSNVQNLLFNMIGPANVSYPLGTEFCDFRDLFQRATGHLKKPKNLQLIFEIWDHDTWFLYNADPMGVLPKFQTVNVETDSQDPAYMSNWLYGSATLERALNIASRMKEVFAPQDDPEEAPKLTVRCDLRCVTPEEWKKYLENGTQNLRDCVCKHINDAYQHKALGG